MVQEEGDELVLGDGRRFAIHRCPPSEYGSGLRGVYGGGEGNRQWVASIRRDGGKEELLGMYETKLEAALAYTREHATAGNSSGEGIRS